MDRDHANRQHYKQVCLRPLQSRRAKLLREARRRDDSARQHQAQERVAPGAVNEVFLALRQLRRHPLAEGTPVRSCTELLERHDFQRWHHKRTQRLVESLALPWQPN